MQDETELMSALSYTTVVTSSLLFRPGGGDVNGCTPSINELSIWTTNNSHGYRCSSLSPVSEIFKILYSSTF